MNHKAAINIIAGQLGISREDRQAISRDVVGVASLTDMNLVQLAKLRAHFDSLAKRSGVKKAASTESWQTTKIKQLWQELGALGALNDPSDKGLRAFVNARSASGVATPQFLPNREASAIIEALKAMLARAKRKAA